MIVNRNYRFNQFVENYAFLVLFIPLLIIIVPILEPGIIINGDFPILDTGKYAKDKIFTWIPNGSYPGVETLPRIPIISLWYLLNMGGVDAESTGKVMIILGFTLASLAFYFAFLALFKDRYYSSNIKLRIGALIGSIIYAYNVWSFLRIGHWYLWVGYGLLPLFLISIIYAFQNTKRWKYIVFSALLWSLASITPHMIIFYGLIYFGLIIIFVINRCLKRQSIKSLVIPTIAILTLYTLLNFYWIYPLLLADSDSLQKLGPQYVLTYEMGEILSRNSDFLNTLRLTTDWTNLEKVEPYPNSIFHSIWTIASFAVPILAFSALLFRRTLSYAVGFLVSVFIGILLSMGTQSPSGYYGLIFSLPFGWLFRDPDKWSFLISLGYSFMAGIAIVGVLNVRIDRPRHIRKILICSFLVLFVFAFTLYATPIYESSLGDGGKFSPLLVPSEFENLNKYLNQIETDKVFFMPYPSVSTDWSSNHSVESIYHATSSKSNIMIGNPSSSYPNLRNYYSYLENQINENLSRNINNFIHPFGSHFIIYHNDTADSTYVSRHANLLKEMNTLEGLVNTDNIGFYKIFDLNENEKKFSPSQGVILAKSIIAVQGLDKLSSLNSVPSFDTMNNSIVFLDQPAARHNDEIVRDKDILLLENNVNDLALSFVNDSYIITPFDFTSHYSPDDVWTRAGAMDPLHGEFHSYLNQLGIANWDFDFGRGLVMTRAPGTILKIPFEVDSSGNYDIFIRYLKNQKGGELAIQVDDDKNKKIVRSEDIRSNNFAWEKIFPKLRLSEGHHTLSVQNVAGFNAVNIFAVIPEPKTDALFERAYDIANTTRSLFLKEAESGLYTTNKMNSNGSPYNDGFDYSSSIKSLDNPVQSVNRVTGASNGTTLLLSPGSEATTEIDILRSSNYTVALRLNSCEKCGPVRLAIEDSYGNEIFKDNTKNIQFDNSKDQLGWLYINSIFLNPGHYKIQINSDTLMDLDLIAVYSMDPNSARNDSPETLDKIFSVSNSSAKIAGLKRIDPTKYEITISNATRPYVLSFAESFDPSWIAYVKNNNNDGTSVKQSEPLYSIINGFSIDELGSYVVIIENRYQQYFLVGGLVSLLTILLCVCLYFVRTHVNFDLLSNHVKRSLKGRY
jgi:hypothetical protein